MEITHDAWSAMVPFGPKTKQAHGLYQSELATSQYLSEHPSTQLVMHQKLIYVF
jgi:hypothetical protein